MKQGIMPGIKVDKGAKPLAMCPGETITEGLDDLRARFTTYRDMGARFAKWRAVITIGDGLPSHPGIHTNAVALARYAALAQEAGLVPIVEPEVLMDGDHTIERCYEATYATLRAVFNELMEQRVILAGMLLKPNMVLSGKDCAQQASVQEVAEATVRCLLHTVPAAMPGVVFLSGGQSSEAATAHLNAMNMMAGPRPWQLSFSFARALQAPALQSWHGDAANVSMAQKAFYHRAKCNSLARYGRYSDTMEKDRGY
jgi:fructose-bisphosphate aldolase class I